MQPTRVHPNAEAIEHILSKELEEDLESLLVGVFQDPHKQTIPSKEEVR